MLLSLVAAALAVAMLLERHVLGLWRSLTVEFDASSHGNLTVGRLVGAWTTTANGYLRDLARMVRGEAASLVHLIHLWYLRHRMMVECLSHVLLILDRAVLHVGHRLLRQVARQAS